MDRADYLRTLAQFLTIDRAVAQAAHDAYVQRVMNERMLRELMESYPGQAAPGTTLRKNGDGRWHLSTRLPGAVVDE